jgi:protein TonB
MLLHGMLALVIPNLKFNAVKTPDILKVELVQKSEPPAAAQSEPVQPQPEMVKSKLLPLPTIKPVPTPIVERDPVEPPNVQSPPEVIAIAPTANIAHTHTAPVQAVKPEVTPSQVEIDDARGQYGNALWSVISKHKKYPKIAQMRGWQGEVIVELQLDGSGKIKSRKISQSSGYEILDNQALEMVEKAQPFPTPPETLRNSAFTITVPVPFKLE